MNSTCTCHRLLVALSLLLTACSGSAYEGRVIDAATGRPAVGVYVIGQWQTGGGFVVSSSGCVLAVTRSDARGEFTLTSGDGVLGRIFGPRGQPATYFYASGYMEQMPKPEREGVPFAVVPDNRPTKERLKHLVHLLGMTDCGTEFMLEHKRQLSPLYRAINDEVRAIGMTKEGWQSVAVSRRYIEILELGWEPATKRAREAYWPGIKDE